MPYIFPAHTHKIKSTKKCDEIIYLLLEIVPLKLAIAKRNGCIIYISALLNLFKYS